MDDLYPYAPPDGVLLLIDWLKDVADTRSERPTGAVLPWIMVRRIGGGDDGLTDSGVYSIHCFGSSKSEAQQLGSTVHRRMCALALPGPPHVDDVVVMESFRAVEYLPGRIHRVVGTYRVRLRYIHSNA